PPAVVDASRRVQASSFGAVLRDRQLLRLNFGIFTLHLVLMAMFVVVPVSMDRAGLPVEEHWKVYLPVVLLSFLVMLPPVFLAERRRRLKLLFVAAVSLMACVQLG